MVAIIGMEINSAEVSAWVGGGIYTDSAEFILSDDAFKAHVYPSTIYNQHMLLDTQPLTPK